MCSRFNPLTVVSGLNLLHTLELILNCRTVTTIVLPTPGNDASIFQKRGKGPGCAADSIHLQKWIESAAHPGADLELPNCHHHRVAHPGNDASIFQKRGKGPITSGLHLLHTLELTSKCRTVTAKVCMTPGHDGSIFQNRSKGPADLAELSPPQPATPQVRTDPSSRIAAKALGVQQIQSTYSILNCHHHRVAHPR